VLSIANLAENECIYKQFTTFAHGKQPPELPLSRDGSSAL